MVTEIRLYFEGHRALKPGFHAFFREIIGLARARRCRLRPISTKGTPVQDYKIALMKHPDAWNVLLLDSDGPDTGDLSIALCQREGVDAPHAGSIFWMVEIMEAWFLADADALEAYYGANFRADLLKGNPNVEEVPKARVYEKLKAATRHSSKGQYHKTKHAPELLARINPGRVKAAAPNCRRMFEALAEQLTP